MVVHLTCRASFGLALFSLLHHCNGERKNRKYIVKKLFELRPSVTYFWCKLQASVTKFTNLN